MYRIVRGSARDGHCRYHRHGWWWHSYTLSEYGYYAPEGPFETKAEAIRHLIWTFRWVNNQRLSIPSNIKWAKGGGYSIKRTMKSIIGNPNCKTKLNSDIL